MKAATLHSFLEDCRAAKTSETIGAAVDQIETMIGAVRAERSKLDGQLGEAVVSGRDPGKIPYGNGATRSGPDDAGGSASGLQPEAGRRPKG
jgi:hypothetical protein